MSRPKLGKAIFFDVWSLYPNHHLQIPCPGEKTMGKVTEQPYDLRKISQEFNNQVRML